MNDQAKEAVAQLLERALAGVDATVEFSQQQIPVVVEQLLMWHLVHSIVLGVIYMSLVVMWIAICYRYRPSQKIDPTLSYYACNTKFNIFTDDDNNLSPILIFTVFVSLIVIGLLSSGVGELIQALKILVAPKLYLLEYGASLLNGKG